MKTHLSLFTGSGIDSLIFKKWGYRTVAYVENNKHCQERIRKRIEDGHIDEAPIFGDVRIFAGFAGEYRGLVDLVTAGPPCQPFSLAGNGLGEADPRNRIPETVECVSRIRPEKFFMENSPTLPVRFGEYFGKIVHQFSEMGYVCRWSVLSAAQAGAWHRRERLWFMADANGSG